jgi:hypothetical protein
MMKVGSQQISFGAGFEQLQLQAAEAAGLHCFAEEVDLLLDPVGIGQLSIGEAGLFAL